ncbi:hypothetical protein [Phenylobacterium sp.]|uniref:hypothetical protein n=1 Tax=Phenylobacterium sp. TaxID=1871053 RepID=UPI0028122D4F|nr:hypothetical protein [Phenylobacterium sp.]
MSGILAWLFPPEPSAAQVRAEVWNLGVRHHGDALAGAIQELEAGGLASSQSQLLRACVRQLGGGQ